PARTNGHDLGSNTFTNTPFGMLSGGQTPPLREMGTWMLSHMGENTHLRNKRILFLNRLPVAKIVVPLHRIIIERGKDYGKTYS
ncbi:hypothetical protein, partial [Phocaeicola sp.]